MTRGAARLSLLLGLSAGLALLGPGCSCDEDVGPGDGSVERDGDTPGEDGGPEEGCGDGVRDRMSEVCDDGNTVDGDGCSADCASDESCGNGIVDSAAEELCDDGNTEDGDTCRGDCLSDYACGNGVVDTIASGGMRDELCDDGNTANGDGCAAGCDSDESCGNGIVDLVAGEVCDDGNTSGDDDCSADCLTSLLCGNGELDGVEECDDGGTDPGDGCNASCQVERCGNGRVDADEDCDDADEDETNGCTTECAFTCSADADCLDADLCDGTETCTDPGTGASACAEGTALDDGAACGSGLLCDGGACVAEGCGDGFVTGSEDCDDANMDEGDGCDNDCTFTCSADGDCVDADVCDGAETCASPGTAASACVAGTPLGDGDACATGRICDGGACVAEGCGDGLVTGDEDCDDANLDEGDGCENDCTFTCSGDTDCSDGNACTGIETCASPGTAASACVAGTPLDEGVACGGGNICRAGSCVSPGCGDGVVTSPEECDDDNDFEGDGCDNDCSFTCDTDLDCSDGNACSGVEVCTGGGSLASRCGAGTPLSAGAPCGGGNICNGGACVAPRCGDGLVTGTEQCDDTNPTTGDGCEPDCTFTCGGDGDCADGLFCNGAEVCTSPGTVASRCGAGTAPPAGSSCGGANICNGGACVAPRCGDGLVTGTEQCDDTNSSPGDGCENDCTFTCTGDADCLDANLCNGTETCSMPGSTASRCVAGTPPATGTLCDRDANPSTRDICRMSTQSCQASICGDSYVDVGRVPPEQCDDGNGDPGDGCSAACQIEMSVPPTAFRVTSLRLISPRIVAQIPLGNPGCQDLTDNCANVFIAGCVSDSINTLLQTAINPTTAGGDFSLHLVDLFRPLDPTAATTPADLHLNAECVEGSPASCGPDPMAPDVISATGSNVSMGTCYVPDPAEVNTRAGTPATYTPTANTVGAVCIRTSLPTLTVTISGIAIPLENATVSATYSPSANPDRLVSGIISGFLSETAATMVFLPDTLPSPLGGAPLYSLLQAGNRTVGGVADSCNRGGGTHEDDADMNGGVRGFRFFLNFEAGLVDWTGP